jgi:L-lactate utilization protein LutC
MKPMAELSWDMEEMIDQFTKHLEEQTGVVYRAKDKKEALVTLSEISEAEGLKRVMASTDDVVAPMDLPAWGGENGVAVITHRDFNDRDSFRDAVFDWVDAGITGVDYAVAESGTMVLVHNRDQARLISLAPILHIAIVPLERLVPVYERVIDNEFGKGHKVPSQVCFITGPSMTGDIQATPFKGMHGPRQVIVILVG